MLVLPRLGYLGYGFADVEVYARQNQKEQALVALRKGIDDGWRVFWWTQSERSPHTELLRGDPEFNAVIDEIRSEMATQLKHVRESELQDELVRNPE
jgi:hypothetical protein